MTGLTRTMEEEIQEILCELLDVEPFELALPRLLARRCADDHECGHRVRSTLECAFGVPIAEAELTRMVDLPGVYEVIWTALASKRRREQQRTRPGADLATLHSPDQVGTLAAMRA